MSLIEERFAPDELSHLPVRVNELLAHADKHRATVVRARLMTEWPVLCDRLSRLYRDTADFSQWLDNLIEQAVQRALERPADLWALDLVREKNPHWLQHGMLGYCAYADKFAGNLQGVKQRIPHLQELGVTYLHLLPFLKAGTPPNDGGFAVASYEEIDPTLGTLEDLKDLTHHLRAAGISLCSDFVLNHVSHEHDWAQRALAGDAHYQSYFHWEHSPEAVAAQEQHLLQIFPSTAPGNFTFVPALKAWVWTTFYPYQWDLNYSQPAVFSDMVNALLKLANAGVEAFRLDSTGFLWKRPGTNCMNQPEVHLILQALRCLTNIAAPATLLKAEAIMPTQELPPYFGLGELRGSECHVAYHSSLMSASWVALAEEKVQIIQDVLSHTPQLPDSCAWMTYVRCHDDIGWNVLRPEMDARGSDQRGRLLYAADFFAGQTRNSYAQGTSFQAAEPGMVHGTNGMAAALVGITSAQDDAALHAACARLVLLESLSLFAGGLPMIYMGDEWGQGNTSEVELHQRQGPDGRELHRPSFDTVGFAKRHDKHTYQGQVFAKVCAFAKARREHVGLQAHHPLHVVASGTPALLVLRRGENIWGIFNFSHQAFTFPRTQPLALPAMAQGVDVCTGKNIELNDFLLPAYGTLWIATT